MVCVWILATFTLSTPALSMPLVLTIPKLYVEHGRCLASSRLCGSVRKYGRQKEVKTEERKSKEESIYIYVRKDNKSRTQKVDVFSRLKWKGVKPLCNDELILWSLVTPHAAFSHLLLRF